MPLFSIIVPTRDRPQLLERALQSAAKQRAVDFELIVSDDGAGDGAALARSIVPSPVTTLITGRRGQVPARNLALQAARGRFVAFLDDDDWWAAENYLARLAEALGDGERLAYASGHIVREGSHAGSGDWIAFEAHADEASLRRDNTLLVSGIAYPLAWHKVHGPFAEDLPHYWDWDWYLRLAGAGRCFVPAPTDAVRVSARTDNVSSPANERARAEELARLSAKHGLDGVVLKNHEVIALEQESRRQALGK